MDSNTFQIDAADPTTSEAMNVLAQMETADAGTGQGAATEPAKGSENSEQLAAQGEEAGVQPPKTGDSGTQATADSQNKSQEKPKAPDAPATAREPSKYEKAATRQADAWKQINTEKEEVRTLRKQLDDQTAQLKRDREAFEAQKAKASQPAHKPEDYDTFAAQKDQQANALEQAGKYEEAVIARYDAKRAREAAKHMRENPPPQPKTDEQAKADKEKLEKEWWGKGSMEFPNAAKQGTTENTALQALLKAEPGLLEDPKAMYYGLRLVTAETAAARVPTIEKELADAQAKVKELTEKLAVDGNGSVRQTGEINFAQKSADDQMAELEQMAHAIDRM